MANTLSVVDRVLKEAQRIAHEKLTFITTTDLQYDKSFTYDSARGPNGQVLRIREPNQYTRRKGSRIMDAQDQDETTQNITVATQDGVDMRFNSQELIQSVNSDGAFDALSRNYIEPAISVLCSGIESDFLAYATKRTYNTVGNSGTAITTLEYPGKARAKLNQNLAPKDGNRSIQMDSVTMGGLVSGVAAYFNPSKDISDNYREGLVARTSMADYYENDRMYSHANSADVTTVLINQASFTNGLSSLTIDGVTAAQQPTVGSVFTIADVYAVHPETKVAYSHLQQFVVTDDSTPTITNISISPKMYWEGPKQNVSAIPIDSALFVWFGAATTSIQMSLMYHKEAFQFVTADLPIFDDAHKCISKESEGLSLRCWMGSDIRNDELLMRIDCLYGFAALRAAWSCRMSN